MSVDLKQLGRLDTSDWYEHRLKRLRKPLYSIDEVGCLFLGYIVIAMPFAFRYFPC